METQENLLKSFDEKIQWGWDMVEQLKLVEKVEGVDKLIRKIQQEVKFLQKVISLNIVNIIYYHRISNQFYFQ